MKRKQLAISILFATLVAIGLGLLLWNHYQPTVFQSTPTESAPPDLTDEAKDEVRKYLDIDVEFSVPEQTTSKSNFVEVQGHAKTEDDKDVTYTAAFVKQKAEKEVDGLVETVEEWVPVHIDVNGKIYVHTLPSTN